MAKLKETVVCRCNISVCKIQSYRFQIRLLLQYMLQQVGTVVATVMIILTLSFLNLLTVKTI